MSVKVHGDEILNHANWEISVGLTAHPSQLQTQIPSVSRKSGSDATGESKSTHGRVPRLIQDAFCSLLVDTQTIEVVNRWRREQGDQELRVADFSKSTEHTS